MQPRAAARIMPPVPFFRLARRLNQEVDLESDATIGGLEELLRCLSLVPLVNEDRLLAYLPLYNRQFLYQKTGYVLQHFKEIMPPILAIVCVLFRWEGGEVQRVAVNST